MEDGSWGAGPGEALAEISTGIVQLYRRHYGQGPSESKTHLVEDAVVCTLRGTFTRAERTLIEQGDHESVHAMRSAFQKGMKAAFTAVVERALNRRVIAFMSLVHIDPDMSIEIFFLEPLAVPTSPDVLA